ncbi:hypothetical protein F441_04312 [Phytophthora nicotianae CJ01A1]|uniref:Uncharacterized protein n=2 Tax=Phytophthora nicotianae TaxID=4792 RepID=V9FM01_PHYNI|nr:hypothetical protein F443_04351 [Phytophthora nicotianae P1569]ETP22346.1 hypothetical protein F441_04312 [Phytophthora nicotianae CJ01A1]
MPALLAKLKPTPLLSLQAEVLNKYCQQTQVDEVTISVVMGKLFKMRKNAMVTDPGAIEPDVSALTVASLTELECRIMTDPLSSMYVLWCRHTGLRRIR